MGVSVCRKVEKGVCDAERGLFVRFYFYFGNSGV